MNLYFFVILFIYLSISKYVIKDTILIKFIAEKISSDSGVWACITIFCRCGIITVKG